MKQLANVSDRELSLEWLQCAICYATEHTCLARERLRRVEVEISRRVGAGEEKPKPPETMAGKWRKERDNAQARQDRTAEEINRPA